jgi:hypothetical protein
MKAHFIEHDDFNELSRLTRIKLAQRNRQKTKAFTAELNYAIAVYAIDNIKNCSSDGAICQIIDQTDQLGQTSKLIFQNGRKPLAFYAGSCFDIGLYRNPITDQALPFISVSSSIRYDQRPSEMGDEFADIYKPVDTSEYMVYEIRFTTPLALDQTEALKTITTPFQLLDSPMPVKHPVPYIDPMPTDEPLEEFSDWLRSVEHNVTDSGKGYRIVRVKTGLPVFRSKSIRGSGKTSYPCASIKAICGVASSFYVWPSTDEGIKALYNQKTYFIKVVKTEHGLQAAIIIPDCVPLLKLASRQQTFIQRLVSTIL